MRAEFIDDTDGPQIKLYFDTQAEYVAWRWLRSKSENNCRLTILGSGGSQPYMTALIGPWPPPTDTVKTITLEESSGHFDKTLGKLTK